MILPPVSGKFDDTVINQPYYSESFFTASVLYILITLTKFVLAD